MIKFFKNIWDYLFGKRKKAQFSWVYIPDNPPKNSIKANCIYIVGNEQYQKWAYLLCPCGCGDIIMLSLNQKSSPSWQLSINELNNPTLYPSIHRTSNCQSHFWLTNGKVIWTLS